MKTLIRFITSNAAGGTEHHDRLVDAPTITIGRATDQVLHLKDKRARLQHAQIEHRDDGAHITTTTLAGVSVNGKSQRDARLGIGDVIEVGANILRVIDAPDGLDFAVSFELSKDASSEHLEASWSTPASGIAGWSKRRLSWSLVSLVLVAGFVLPWLFFQNFLLAGPIHSAHSSIGDDCSACHISIFQRVPDSGCIDCHTVARHADAKHAVLGDARCASCHLEHNEPPQLVNQHQALCTDCHTDLPEGVELQRAGDFLDDHPGFMVSLKRPFEIDDAELSWRIEQVELATALAADRSNLKFDHKIHLEKDGIMTPDGNRVVECAECHTPEPGGARMQAISMDEHCSNCHTLAFDPDDPTRTVPHGDAEAVVQALIEYYSARLLGDDPDAVERRVRRPGQSLTRVDRDRAAAEAREQALAVAEDLFERRACANCHEVSRVGGDLPWYVKPVQLTDAFFRNTNFTHAAHETEVTSCDSCHNASTSELATDLLIPGIDSCRECHGSGNGSRNSGSQLPSTCVMCHGFHFETREDYP